MQDSLVTIAINIFSARNLPKADPTGLSDPYIILTYTSLKEGELIKKRKKTETIKESLSPTWNNSFVLKNVASESILTFNCFDWDNAFKFSSDDFLGKFKIMVERIPINKKVVWRVPLMDSMKSAGDLMFCTYAIPSTSFVQTQKKMLLGNVILTIEEMDTPLYVCRYQNRLDVNIQKTKGFINEKEKIPVYAQVSVGKQILETTVWKKKGDPFWNSTFSFSFKNANNINIQIKDWKMVRTNTTLGSVTVNLFDIPDNQLVTKEVPIKGGNGTLCCSFYITKYQMIDKILPIECEIEDDGDDWCKQNIQPFESFTDECNPKGIIDSKCKGGYHFELSKDDIGSLLNEDVPIFNENYFEKPIEEGIIPSVNKRAFYNTVKTSTGPILIVVGDEVGGLKKAVVISQFGTVKTYVKDIRDIDSEIMNVYGLKKEQVKMKECGKEIWSKLIEYESRNRRPAYKFGLVVATQGQKFEQQFLSNTTTSPLCQEFFNLIGKTIVLKGYNGYRGGLDVQNNTTGTHSIVSSFKGIDIMFHVSTMLQHEANDEQHLAKKRHIGNDVCVIIFKETNNKKDDEIDLNSFITQFNHVFIIVSPVVIKGVPLYRVCVCCKSAVQGFLPHFPPEKYFPRDRSFVDWLLCKTINGERASLESPQFIKSQRVAQKGLLEVIISNIMN
ncbi:Rap GTPase-activating protein, putative [Entamoeba histolytica KU27]|uniref:Rap GTPase-activating protein, putative n=1 Tax=Entamoeba histolytica KU27 TaxID=885311 RepID=M2S4B9_ENTHI|nr:Rap GTPase-activating protein, putative [Entamoeba histolytica KU27]